MQYSVDKNIVQIGEEYHFYHNGRIAVGKIGSGKSSELKELLENLYPVIIKNGKIELGTELFFSTVNGLPFTKEAFQSVFKEILTRAGIYNDEQECPPRAFRSQSRSCNR